MGSAFQWRRFVYAQAAFVLVLVVGTAGFQAILGEGWVSSFYRTVVTTTLTGLDSQPPGAGAKLFTILLLLGGVAIFLYLAGAIVDLIAHGAISEAYAERKLRRTIDDLHDHAIICGFGRVGRRVAAEFEAIGSSYVVLKPQVAAFLDIATTAGGAFPELRFEEILVTKECTPCGRSIADLRIRQATGALVVAIRKHDGTYDVTPTSDAVFEQGDVVIGVGTTEEMSKLEQLFAPSGAAA